MRREEKNAIIDSLAEDTKKKMSIASTGRPHPCSEEQREKIRLSHLRKKASEETKLKISQSCLSIEKREHTCEICEAVFLSRHRGIVKYCSKKCKAKRFKQTHPDYEKQRYAIRLLRKL